jgi:glutamate N-acetyltransferase/amino-acid N-acetyltransferase
MFTTNRVQAAPVKVCRERLRGRRAMAVVINSGSANACTGRQGMADAKRMARLAAVALGVPEAAVFPCSTGTIGKPLPMDRIARGVPQAAAALSEEGGEAAARAIMTTDTAPKQAAVEVRIDGRPVRIGGMAKGAGMIEPNMATLLAFLTTDATVEPRALRTCLRGAVGESFNRISVDGDTSTNDTVLFLANGLAGNRALSPAHREWKPFCAAVREVSRLLAMKIVDDGEGATKFVVVTVKGARTGPDARRAARAVARSLLVKTSWYGGDPNWGRVIAAVGYSGAAVEAERIEIRFNGKLAVQGGRKAPRFALKELERILKQRAFSITIDLHLGRGTDTVYTCDCSEEYVRINSAYLT